MEPVPSADFPNLWAFVLPGLPYHLTVDELTTLITGCRLCPRLVAWREEIAATKRASFRHEPYWGKPVPGFGSPTARVMVVGLAPAAHGANRTGRMFTGDRSGEWLYRALFQTGFANQPIATDRNDGLELTDAYVTSIVHCAPPANAPTALERDTCRRWLEAEVAALGSVEVIVALGGMAFGQLLRLLVGLGAPVPRPRPRFGHGVELALAGFPTVLASYHPSQQNTFTGRLTEPMLRSVFETARALLGPDEPGFPLSR